MTSDEVAVHMRRSEENASAAGVAAGLEDAKATLAGIWRRTLDDDARARAMRAMQAVIWAETTLLAADAFLLAATPEARCEALKRLRMSAVLRLPKAAGADAQGAT